MKNILGASQLMGVADLTKRVFVHTRLLPLIKDSNARERLEIESMNKLFPRLFKNEFVSN